MSASLRVVDHDEDGVVREDVEVGGVNAAEFRQFVEGIERLMEEQEALKNDIKERFQEADSRGYPKKYLRQFIALRKKDPKEVDEAETWIDLWKRVMGMS